MSASTSNRDPLADLPRFKRMAHRLDIAAGLLRAVERDAIGALTYPGDGQVITTCEATHLVGATPLIAGARGQVEAALEMVRSGAAHG